MSKKIDRLTSKYNDSYALNMDNVTTEKEARECLKEKFKAVCNKLGELEDLEQEIGLPIKELFNLIGTKIYIICRSYDMCYEDLSINYDDLLDCVDDARIDYVTSKSVIYSHYDTYEFPINYFGVGWFLSFDEAKEALERRLEKCC